MSKKSRLAKRNDEDVASKSSTTITKDKSPYVHQKSRIDFPLNIRQRDDLTSKQKELIDTILDKNTKVVFINGPAGSSKTFLGVLCGLMLLDSKKMSHLTYVRTIVESASKSLGSLPGDQGMKMEPFLMPLFEKLDEMLPAGDIKRLMTEERIKGIPVNYLRGASFNAQYILVDEAQNMTHRELVTAITRIGQFSKMIFVGDSAQSDLNGRSGFMPMFDLFNDESSRMNGIHCISLGKEDVVRSGILRFICERIESMPKPVLHASKPQDKHIEEWSPSGS